MHPSLARLNKLAGRPQHAAVLNWDSRILRDNKNIPCDFHWQSDIFVATRVCLGWALEVSDHDDSAGVEAWGKDQALRGEGEV